MTQLTDHMEREFRAAGLMSGTSPEEEQLVQTIRALAAALEMNGALPEQNTQALQLFDRLVNFKPLTPLRDNPEDWIGGEDSVLLQHKRCSTVFKHTETGETVDVGMKTVYVDPTGLAATRPFEPAPEISFPYMPGFPPVVAIDSEGQLL